MRRVRAFFRRLGRGIGHFFTHWTKKKVVLTAAAVLLVGAAAVFGLPKLLRNQAISTMARTSSRTTILHKSNLTKSISVTGTVESASVANVTSTANYKVKEILVQEGDTVIIGQTLCQLDTTDLEKQIAKQQESLVENIASAQKSYNEAVETCDEAHAKALEAETTVSSAKTTLDAATANFNGAKSSVAAYQNAYNSAYSTEQAAGMKLNSSDYLSKQTALAAATTTPANADAALAQANDVLSHTDPSDAN